MNRQKENKKDIKRHDKGAFIRRVRELEREEELEDFKVEYAKKHDGELPPDDMTPPQKEYKVYRLLFTSVYKKHLEVVKRVKAEWDKEKAEEQKAKEQEQREKESITN